MAKRRTEGSSGRERGSQVDSGAPAGRAGQARTPRGRVEAGRAGGATRASGAAERASGVGSGVEFGELIAPERRRIGGGVRVAADRGGAARSRRVEASILESAPRRESATRESRESSNAEFDFSRALDAWHYSYTDSLTRARIRAQPEAIFGRDDRVAVADTTVYPSSSICFLKIWLQGGGFGVGTGWLIGRRTVITAGHCVFAQSQRYFGWAQQIEVIPGNAGSSAPFGSFVAPMHSLRSVSGWTEQGRVADDYGAIVLDEDVPAACGFFGFSSLSDAELRPIKVTVRGYPGEESKQGTMWEHSSFLSERQQPRRLLYTIDTTPGQSGSPAFYLDQSVALALGIHNYGEDMSNFATRINDAVFDDLLAWKNEGGG